MKQTPLRATFDLAPAGRAVAILGSLALGVAWTTGNEPARLATCLLLAPLLVDWACKLRRFTDVAVSVGRRRTRAGAALVETITLRNRSGRGLWHVLVRENGLATCVRGQAALVEHLPGGTDCEVDLLLRVRTRGHRTARTFTLTTLHPFGLVRVSAPVVASATLIAEPARVTLPVALDDRGRAGENSCDTPRGPTDATFFALRELRDGEDFARVHALRSASLGTPVRVLRRGAAQHTARVLLDLRGPPGRHPQRCSGPPFEWALSAAASLVEDLARRGHPCDVEVLGSTRTRFAGIGEGAEPSAFLEHLARAQPQRYAPTPAATLSWLGASEGQAFWIVAGGYAATREREHVGRRLQVLESTA